MAESFDHPGRVLLAFPSTGHDISTRFMRSFWELDVWDRERAVQVWEALDCPESPNPIELRLLHNYVALEATANLAKARNRLCDEFLKTYTDAEWLWFVDTDMVFEPQLMHQMVARAVEHDIKILGALCVILTADGDRISVDAVSTNLVDTTGAGDLYAAGVLTGWATGQTLAESGRMGSLAAGEVISHLGARPQKPLSEIWKDHR